LFGGEIFGTSFAAGQTCSAGDDAQLVLIQAGCSRRASELTNFATSFWRQLLGSQLPNSTAAGFFFLATGIYFNVGSRPNILDLLAHE
jgi:hypothetical protein